MALSDSPNISCEKVKSPPKSKSKKTKDRKSDISKNTNCHKKNIDNQSLVKQRKKEILSFVDAIRSPSFIGQLSDDEVFALTIKLAIEDYGLKQKDLAKMLHTDSSTIGRWKSAESVPNPFSRNTIIEIIATILSDNLSHK